MKRKLIILFTLFCLSTNVIAQATNFLWAKKMGGASADYGYSIAVDASSNVYTTGDFTGTVDLDPGVGTYNLTSAGSSDIFISKLDASGNFVWAKSIGSNNADGGRSISADALGNVYTTGYFAGTADFDPGSGTYNLTSTAGAVTDIFVSKLDASGNFVWAKNMGGTDNDYGLSIAVDASGNVYTTGSFIGTADLDPGPGVYNLTDPDAYWNTDIFVSKLDASGNFVWAKNMGGNYAVGLSITVDASGNVYTTGYFLGRVDFDPGPAMYDLVAVSFNFCFISKLDASGNFVWAIKMINGGYNSYGNAIKLDVSGNIYVTGNFEGAADFDPGPGIFNLTSFGNADIFISKIDASGKFVWAKNMGSGNNDVGTSIALDFSGNVYTTGRYLGTVDFDPGPNTYNLTSPAGNSDMFISKLDPSGNFVWAGDEPSGSGTSIALNTSGDIYATGYFICSGGGGFPCNGDFDPGPGKFNLIAEGGRDIFVLKLGQSSSCTAPASQASNISFSSISANQMTVNWTNGNGSRRVVKINTTNSFTAPANATDPTANSVYNGGQQVVYNNNGNSVTITGLTPGTTYWFRIYEANCSGSNSLYKTSVETNNPNSQSTQSTVTIVNSITFTNDIENHTDITPLFTLYTGSAFVTNIPIKICADGSTSTYIKVNVSNTSGISFRILDENNQSTTDVDKFGQLSIPYVFGNNVEVAYTHPQYLDVSGVTRHLKLEILNNNVPTGIRFPLDIYRAPIVFVHGFEGNNTTFENLRDNLIFDNLYPPNSFEIRTTDFNGAYTSNGLTYTCAGNCIVNETVIYNPLLHLIDYKKTNGKSFSVNAKNNTVANGIDSVFKTARSNNYSCGKVILIGHSMGGVLSRLYLQSTFPDYIGYENYRFDIQKLITVNTPHYGTQFANHMLSLDANILKLITISSQLFSNKYDAINDLRVNSYATDKYLNISRVNQNKVPAHTISTSVTDPLILNDYVAAGVFVKSLVCDFNLLLGWYNCKNIFNSESNDEIVPLLSQQGGFNWGETDFNRFHVGSTKSEFVQTDVKALINSSPFNSNFSSSGFAQKTLGYNYRYFKSNSTQPARTLSDSIKILNIVDGQSFNLGDSINVVFSNTSGINSIKAYLTGGANTKFIGSISKPNSTIKFKTDNDEVGSRWIYLLGFDSLTFVDWDSVRINLNTSVQLDSIKISPRNINLPLGYSEIISINGYYHDDIIRDIKNAVGLSLAFDTSKIAIDNDYKVTSKKGPFKILLAANYLNKRDTILIGTTANSSDNIADYSSDRNTICTGSQINYLDVSLGIVQSRSWQFPGGSPSSSNSQSPTVTYNSPGTYNVTLIVTYLGKTDTISRSNYITVNPISSTPTITMGTATTFCNGGSVILTSNAASGNQWYKDGVAISDSTRTKLNVTASGSYTVKVTVNSCESAASNAIVVTSNPIPATPTITQNTNQLVSSAASGNQWYLNNVIIPGATGQNYTPTASGNYTVQVTANNCASAFSNNFAYIFTSIPNIDAFGNQVNVVPNPVEDKLVIIRSNPALVLNIQLFDINGRRLKIFTSSLSRTEIDMAKYAAGLYIIRIEDRRNKILGKKVIVKLK